MDLTKYVAIIRGAWPGDYQELTRSKNFEVWRVGNGLVCNFASDSRCSNRVLTSDRLIHKGRVRTVTNVISWTLQSWYSVFINQNLRRGLWRSWVRNIRPFRQNLWSKWVYQDSSCTSRFIEKHIRKPYSKVLSFCWF